MTLNIADRLLRIELFKTALSRNFAWKMVVEGYCDVSELVNTTLTKNEIRIMTPLDSPIRILYDGKYPSYQTIFPRLEEVSSKYGDRLYKLSAFEYDALIKWSLMVETSKENRLMLFENILKKAKLIFIKEIGKDITRKGNLFYNSRTVEPVFIKSINDLLKQIEGFNLNNKSVFFRGHSNLNHRIIPSLFRNDMHHNNELTMYNELLRMRPGDFVDCNSTIERLVKMQHFGLPTRLLDVTRNPLVALYFACTSSQNTIGEVITFVAERNHILHHDNNIVTAISNLALLESRERNDYISYLLSENSYRNSLVNHLLKLSIDKLPPEENEAKADALEGLIKRPYFINVPMNNDRIVRQDGAFMIFSMQNKDYDINKLCYRNNSKRLLLLISPKAKAKILSQLNLISINQSQLFPDIENTSRYIKEKFSQ